MKAPTAAELDQARCLIRAALTEWLALPLHDRPDLPGEIIDLLEQPHLRPALEILARER